MKKKSANKMQAVKFRSLDEFLEFLPADELKMVHVLRNMLLECIPGIQEKLSYNVPFYRKRSGICFIWPASILWGKKKTWKGVRLGFNKGYMMRDEINYLDKSGRKQVYWRDFQSLNDIEPDMIRAYIFEAAEPDKPEYKNTKR